MTSLRDADFFYRGEGIVSIAGVEAFLACNRVPIVSLDAASPFTQHASWLLQTALDENTKAGALYDYTTDLEVEAECRRRGLERDSIMLAHVKRADLKHIQAAGTSKRATMFAILLAVCLECQDNSRTWVEFWNAIKAYDWHREFSQLLRDLKRDGRGGSKRDSSRTPPRRRLKDSEEKAPRARPQVKKASLDFDEPPTLGSSAKSRDVAHRASELLSMHLDFLPNSRVPVVQLAKSSPLDSLASSLLQQATESMQKAESLFRLVHDRDLTRECEMLGLSLDEFAVAGLTITGMDHIRAVGRNGKRCIMLALVVALVSYGEVTAAQIENCLTMLLNIDAKKAFVSLLHAVSGLSSSGRGGQEERSSKDRTNGARASSNRRSSSPSASKALVPAKRPRTTSPAHPKGRKTDSSGEDDSSKNKTTNDDSNNKKQSGAPRRGARSSKPKLTRRAKDKNILGENDDQDNPEDQLRKKKEREQRQLRFETKGILASNGSFNGSARMVSNSGQQADGESAKQVSSGEAKKASTGGSASATVLGSCMELEKPYVRLASEVKESEVRPLPVLMQAFDMVKEKWRESRDWVYAGEMLRSIRQDLRVQMVRNDFTLKVYEFCARASLEVGDFLQYDQCATVLEDLHADGALPKVEGGGTVAGPPINKREFIAYRMLHYAVQGDEEDLFLYMREHEDALRPESRANNVHLNVACGVREALRTGRLQKAQKLLAKLPRVVGGALRRLLGMLVEHHQLLVLASLCKAHRGNLEISMVQRLVTGSSQNGLDALPLILRTDSPGHVDLDGTVAEAEKLLAEKRRVVRQSSRRQSSEHMKVFVRASSMSS